MSPLMPSPERGDVTVVRLEAVKSAVAVMAIIVLRGCDSVGVRTLSDESRTGRPQM